MIMINIYYEKRVLFIYCKIYVLNFIYNWYVKRVFVNYILDYLKQVRFLNYDDFLKYGEFCRIFVDF